MNVTDVPPHILEHVLKPGKYVGKIHISPTNLYKNGTINDSTLTLVKEGNNISFTNNINARDCKTNKIAYTAKRTGLFFYKPNHGNNLFRSSKSYIGNTIVSNINGHAINHSNNHIDFVCQGSWHHAANDYKQINLSIDKNSSGFNTIFKHFNVLGMNDFTMNEQYNNSV